MNHVPMVLRSLAAAGLAVLILAACGKESPEALIASSKNFIAKGDYKAATIQLRNALQQQAQNGEARYLLGLTLSENGEYPAAEKEFGKALEYGFSQDQVIPALAKAMLRQGANQRLVKDLADKSLGDAAAIASLNSTVGLAYIGLGQPVEARAAFDAALKARPDDAQAKVGEAILLAQGGDLPAAMKVIEGVLAKDPLMPEALSLKADLLLAQNDVAGATRALEDVIKVQPSNVQARFALASLFIRERKYDEARTVIDAMKKVAPGDVRAEYLESLLAYRQGDATKSRDAALQVLKVNPNHAPSLFLAGAASYQLGSLESATEYLRKVLTQFPRNAEARNLLIATMLRTGNPEKAQELLQPALKDGAGDPRLLRLAGEVALANNKLAEAGQYYEQAAKIDNDAAVRTRLGQIRLATGDVDRALNDLSAASELDANQYQSDLALISAYLRRGQADKALEAAAVLEKKQPKNPLTYNVKGLIYTVKRDYKSAREGFVQALALKPDYLPAVRNLAQLDLLEKDPKAARGRFEAVVAADPKNAMARVGLAEVLAATGAPGSEVAAALEGAVKSDPTSVPAAKSLINYRLRTGNAKAALELAETASASNREDAELMELLGVSQQATGASTQAIATFNKVASMRPKSPEPLVRIAAVQFASKDYEAAIQSLRKALAIRPDLVSARQEIAVVELAAGRPDRALAEARALQKDFPKNAAGFALEGDVNAAQKKWAASAAAYREAMTRQPAPVLAVRLHAVLEADGKSADAAAFAAKWLKDNPTDVALRSYLGERSIRQKDFKTAAKYYKEAIALQPDNALLLNNLAWASAELNDPAAIEYAEKAYAIAPANPAVLDTYGWLLLKKGDAKRAVELLTDAAARAPKSGELRLHLAKALIESGDKSGARKELQAIVELGAEAPQRAEAEELLKKI